MGEAALNLERSQKPQQVELELIETPAQEKASNSLLFLATLLITLQVLDGILTGFGMHLFGISHEGNPLLRGLMESIGYTNALILTKGFAILVVCFLVKIGSHVSWLENAMMGVAALYIGAAIIPWSIILAGAVFF